MPDPRFELPPMTPEMAALLRHARPITPVRIRPVADTPELRQSAADLFETCYARALRLVEAQAAADDLHLTPAERVLVELGAAAGITAAWAEAKDRGLVAGGPA